jgi:hypothetical protein
MVDYIQFYKKNENSYTQCRIITKQGFVKGCFGNVLIVTLSDGRKIRANNVWVMREISILPENALTGKMCIDYKNETVDENYIV